MMWLLANWKTAIAVAAALAVAWMLHSIVTSGIESKHRAELVAQAEALNSKCAEDKKITEEISNAYEAALSDLNSKYDALVRLRPRRCVAVSASKPPSGDHATSAGGELPRQDGVTSGTLYEYARDAEQVRLKLLGCQDFIRNTWDSGIR